MEQLDENHSMAVEEDLDVILEEPEEEPLEPTRVWSDYVPEYNSKAVNLI